MFVFTDCEPRVVSCSEGVQEYLRLSADANSTQQMRIQGLFDQRNQKYTQNIAELEARLNTYRKRIKELETANVTAAVETQKRTVGQGIK